MRAAAWRLCVAATGDAARWPALCRSPSPLPPPPPLPLLSGARLFADKPAAPAAKKAAPAAAAAPKSKRAGTPLERRPKVWNKEVIDISGPKSGGKLVATGRVTAVVGAVVDVQFDKVRRGGICSERDAQHRSPVGRFEPHGAVCPARIGLAIAIQFSFSPRRLA